MRIKKLKIDTTFDDLLRRFNEGDLQKTDYRFLATHMRTFKEDVRYKILKAKIQSLSQTILRSPKKTENAAYDLGRLEGLDFIFNLIDDMCKYDVNISKEEEQDKEEHINPDQLVHNDPTPIV